MSDFTEEELSELEIGEILFPTEISYTIDENGLTITMKKEWTLLLPPNEDIKDLGDNTLKNE